MNVTNAPQEEKRFYQSIYDQLFQVAEHALSRENPGHTLEPTLLANDAYLRLLKQRNVDPTNRSEMLAAGTRIIQRLLIDYSRKRKALKRGGECQNRIPLHSIVEQTSDEREVIELRDLLKSFAKHHPRCARVVILKFFVGLTNQEIADEICVSVRTVKSDWKFARGWIYRKLHAA